MTDHFIFGVKAKLAPYDKPELEPNTPKSGASLLMTVLFQPLMT